MDEHLSHAGDECDLAWLSLFDEVFIVGLDDGVSSGGDEGGHVECGSDGGSSASDGSLALLFS